MSSNPVAPFAPNAPIGIFDSGVGGLGVVHEVLRHLPNERVLYVADQAHVPYGARPLEEVREFASILSRYLLARGCKVVVMACNISSATALDSMRREAGADSVLGVIDAGAQAAVNLTRTRKIGVLATVGTVATGAYTRALHALSLGVQVLEVPCPELVPLVESGNTEGAEASEAARAYLAPLAEAGVDTVILGCTHYPLLLPVFERAAPAETRFIDPAPWTALELRRILTRRRALNETDVRPEASVLLTTGSVSAFRAQMRTLWTDELPVTEHVSWDTMLGSPTCF